MTHPSAPVSMRDDAREPFWAKSAAAWFAALDAGPDGLSSAQARARLARDGPNTVAPATRRKMLAKLARRLSEPLVAILVVAAIVAGLTGDVASLIIILVIVLASVALDIAQEDRAERAAEALRRSVAIHADVLRDGALVSKPVEDIVAGDVVVLRAGDLAPADGIVLASRSAAANESLLTGEAFPAEKRPGPSGAREPAEAFDAMFGGTALVSGEATMLVVATGGRTLFGGVAAALESREPPTAFERGLHDLGVLIVRLTIFLVLFVLLAHLAFARPALESFMFAVALAVGLTPELLPMVLTVTLSRGAVRMAARKVVVKKLAAIHDLGAMDVICTDKTGTLTEARIALVGHPGPWGEDGERVLELAAVNSRFETGVRSPLDEAILGHAAGLDLSGWRKIDDLPFDFERRRVSVLAERGGLRLAIVKGAPEEIIRRSVAAEGADGGAVALDDAGRARLNAFCEKRERAGERLIAVAWREVARERERLTMDDEHNLTIAGFCAFVDPPKASARSAIAQLAQLGVKVKIVSGDAPAAVAHVVESLDLPARNLMTGAEIAALDDTALAARVRDVDIYARVSPDQKSRIIRALQATGQVAGFLGDGINDAPAIKAADVGMSVDGATDVARAAADMILLEPDLGVLAQGVEEGRRTYVNVMKYVRMGTSSNFGNMLSMAFASLFLPFLPLTAIQILLNNLFYDLSEIGIPFDNVDPAEIAAPHSWDMRAIQRFTLTMGPLSSVFDAATFGLLIYVFQAAPETFRAAWFVESICTQVLVIFLIRAPAAPWNSRPHPALTLTTLGALAGALTVALGPAHAWFGFAALQPGLLLSLAALTLGYLVCAEWLKRFAMARPGA